MFTSLRDVRHRSQSLKTYPWKNGCILENGPLEPWVTKTMPADTPPHVCSLIQVSRNQFFFVPSILTHFFPKTLASEIDKLEIQPLWADSANLYAASVLIPEQVAITETMAAQAYFGKLLLSYQLLDTLVWCQGWPAHEQLTFVPRTETPPSAPQLERIIKHLDNWHSIIPATAATAIQHLTITSEEPSMTREVTFQVQPGCPDTNLELWRATDVKSNTLKAAVVNIYKASEHSRRSQTHEVLEQWYSVAFAIAAFRPVSSIAHSSQVHSLITS
jgi:hypothetical protein